MNKYLKILPLLFFILSGSIFGQNIKPFLIKNPLAITSFIENKGQWQKINNKIPILFQTEKEDQLISLTPNGFYWENYYTFVPKDSNKIGNLDTHNTLVLKKVIQFELIHANTKPQITKEGKTDYYFSYGDKQLTSFGYQKIIYHNIYPNIDWIIQIDSLNGNIKYSFDLHENSNITDIKIKYTGDPNDKISLNLVNDKLVIRNYPFLLSDSGLIASAPQTEKSCIAHYKIHKNKLTFDVENYTRGTPLIIDPWVQKVYLPEDDSLMTSRLYYKYAATGNVNTFLNLMPRRSNNIAIKVDFDYNNNSYIYGGPWYPSQHKLSKYNSNGKKQWMFMGSVPSVNFKYVEWSNGYLGSMLVQKNTGKVFTCNGFSRYYAQTIRLNDSGYYDNYITGFDPYVLEQADIELNCENGKLYLLGMSRQGTTNYAIASLDSSNIKFKSIKGSDLHNNNFFTQYGVCSIVDDSGNFYYLLSSVKTDTQLFNTLIKTTVLNKVIFRKKTGFISTNIVQNHPNRACSGCSNSANVLALNKNYLFYYDGKYLAAYNKFTGNHVGNIDSSSKKIPLDIQGISVDDCNNVYVGGDSATIRIYHFNGTNFKLQTILNPLNSSSKQQVNDVRINVTNQLIFYCGDSLLGVANNPYACFDSSYYSKNPLNKYNFCQNQPLIVSLSNPAKDELYTFQWTDSAKNEMVRNVSIKNKFSDTLFNPKPFKTYKVNVTKSKTTFCGGDYFQLTYKTFPTKDTVVFDTLCQGLSYSVRKKTFTTDTSFSDSLSNRFGCDSIVTYHLHFLKKSFTSQKINRCKGDTLFVGTKAYTKSGNYLDSLVNALGCDSVISTQLFILKDSLSQTIHLCNATFYKVGHVTHLRSGVYLDTLHNQFGCDSIVRTVLILHFDTTVSIFKILCNGNSLKIGNHIYTKSGVYRDTFKRFNGCDSFVQSTLKFISDTTISKKTSICQGDSIKVGKHVYNRTDNYIDSLKKFQGCDSIIKTSLTVHPKYNLTKFIHLCPKESILINGKTYSQSQTFKYPYKTSNGCDSVVEFTIVKSDLESIFTIDSAKNPSMTFNNISKKDVKFYWRFDNSTDSTHRNLTKNYQNDSSKTYQICLIVKDSFGCVDTVCQSFNLTKLAYMIFNSFTPNNDGYNDIFKIKSIGGTFNYDIQVFNRWGAKVFEQIHASSSDQTKLWNGLVMNIGAECPSGSYFAIFQIYLKGSNNPPEVVHGVITLIR